jgi:hypothetical protein
MAEELRGPPGRREAAGHGSLPRRSSFFFAKRFPEAPAHAGSPNPQWAISSREMIGLYLHER